MQAMPQSPSWPAHWDPHHLQQRLAVERICAAKLSQPNGFGNLRKPGAYSLLGTFLRLSRLHNRGYRNFLNPVLRTVHHLHPDLPANLHGFRILQLSDLHIDLDPALADPVCRLLTNIQCDLSVITGDFWDCSLSDHRHALPALQNIIQSLPQSPFPPYAVLGNHDTAALGAWLEQQGLPVLLNEAIRLQPPGRSTIALAGVDDAYLFRCADIPAARTACPPEAPFRILLSHSPQTAPQAAQAGFHLQLSGHTHGGQIRLPRGRNLVRMPGIPPAFFDGPWQLGSLLGYTSRGTGGSHLPVRFNCPSEIVLHILQSPLCAD